MMGIQGRIPATFPNVSSSATVSVGIKGKNQMAGRHKETHPEYREVPKPTTSSGPSGVWEGHGRVMKRVTV